MNGISWPKNMPTILISEVGGSFSSTLRGANSLLLCFCFSSYLIKSVVMTSITVKLTVRAASKKKGLKKVVEYVIPSRRKVGK